MGTFDPITRLERGIQPLSELDGGQTAQWSGSRKNRTAPTHRSVELAHAGHDKRCQGQNGEAWCQADDASERAQTTTPGPL